MSNFLSLGGLGFAPLHSGHPALAWLLSWVRPLQPHNGKVDTCPALFHQLYFPFARMNRVPQFVTFSSIMSASLLSIGTIMASVTQLSGKAGMQAALLAALMVATTSYGLGVGAVPYTMLGEVFTPQHRCFPMTINLPVNTIQHFPIYINLPFNTSQHFPMTIFRSQEHMIPLITSQKPSKMFESHQIPSDKIQYNIQCHQH